MAKAPLRLMALGGSVTYGQGSSHGNGYRNALRQLLLAGGFEVEMVGSRRAGSMQNNHTEGWRGSRIDQIMNKAKLSVPKHLPNLFTVNAGSNDCLQDLEIDRVGDRMESLLEYLWTASPDSTVLLSTLLVNADRVIELRVIRANEQFANLVQRKLFEQKRIVLVDMHCKDGPQCSELTDGTHPNDAGYDKMAQLWYEGIQKAVAQGFIRAPLPRDRMTGTL